MDTIPLWCLTLRTCVMASDPGSAAAHEDDAERGETWGSVQRRYQRGLSGLADPGQVRSWS